MNTDTRDSAYRLARIVQTLREADRLGPAHVRRQLWHAADREAGHLLRQLAAEADAEHPLPAFDPTLRCPRCGEPVFHCRCDFSSEAP